MRLENDFEVPAPVHRVWDYMLDVERVVPCMPGAELTETIDDSSWKGKVTIKVGPVQMSFQGQVTMRERDEAAHKFVLFAKGMEQRGKGAASATVTSALEQSGDGTTRVKITQELDIQGQAAQMSRGMLPDVTATLTKQFAECLRSNIEAAEGAPSGEKPGPVVAGGEVKGVSLAAGALWARLKRFFRRLFGRR